MSHTKFYPARARIEAGEQPLNTVFHDVLLISPPNAQGQPVLTNEQFVRFPVVKVTKGYDQPGQHVDPPEVWDRTDTGQRKVIGIANPELVGPGQQDERGPAFAVMPVRAEPGASSCAMCYLIDANNMVSPNAWTAEEWSSPQGPNLPPGPVANATETEVLLGLPRGIVLRFKATGLDKLDYPNNYHAPVTVPAGNGVQYEIEPVYLKREPEVWNQLRNGTIAGRALYRALRRATDPEGQPRVLPLVNVTSLQGVGQ